jgi:predicted DNA-binding transcriptional regulator AlpA
MDDSTPILANADALPEILKAKELETLLRIDVKTIYRYAELGILPHLRMESNLRFPKRQVLEWLEERNFRPARRRGTARRSADNKIRRRG